MKKQEKTKNITYRLGYYFVFCPKYRRKVLTGEVEVRLKEIIYQLALENDWQVDTLEVMPDHVHLFVKVTPMDSPHDVVARIKDRSAAALRKEFASLNTRLPALWTRSYYVESIGSISAPAITRFMEEQKSK